MNECTWSIGGIILTKGTFPSVADLTWTHLETNIGSVQTGWQLIALSMAQPVMDVAWIL